MPGKKTTAHLGVDTQAAFERMFPAPPDGHASQAIGITVLTEESQDGRNVRVRLDTTIRAVPGDPDSYSLACSNITTDNARELAQQMANRVYRLLKIELVRKVLP